MAGLISRAAPVVVFLSCFALATFTIGMLSRFALPARPVTELTGKLDDLVAKARDADTIAIGSSRMLTAFDAPSFNEASRAAGCDDRSYNLSFAGLNLVEMEFVLKKLRALGLPRLRRIVVDMPNLIHVQFENMKSSRIYVTTDPAAAPRALADILSHPDPRTTVAVLRYVIAFLYHNSAIGTFSSYLSAGADRGPDRRPTRLGYLALHTDAVPTRLRLELLANAAEFGRTLDAVRGQQHAAPRPPLPGERLRISVASQLIDLVKSFGYDPIILALPQADSNAIVDARSLQLRLPERNPGLIVVNTMSPDYPIDVYAAGSWYDVTHVDHEMARAISIRLAADVCRTGQARQ